MKRNRARGVSSKFQIGAALAMAVVGVTGLFERAKGAGVQLQDTNLTLTDPGAWIGGVPPQPTDTAVLGSALTGAVNTSYTWSLGAGTSNFWLGIQVLNPGGNISINDTANTLVLAANGIDMSAATRSLTLSTAINLATNQTWNVGAGTALIVNGTVLMGTSALTIAGAGDARFTGGLLGGAASVRKFGTGNLILSSQNTYTGGTTLGNATFSGGITTLDFSGVNAPATNILSSSALSTSNATVNLVGNAAFAVSQTIGGSTFAFGLTTLTSTASGMGVTVNLGTIVRAINQGASVRIIPNANATLSNFLATNAGFNGANTGLVEVNDVSSAANGGAYMTYGLSDFAAVNAGVIGPATYFPVVGTANVGTAIGRVFDLNGTNNVMNSGGVFIDAVRFSGPGAKSWNVVSGLAQLGGVLVAPSVGANDVTISITGTATGIRTGTNADMVIWQNNTQGNLIITAPLSPRGGTGSIVKNGAGNLIITTTAQGMNGNMYINEGFVQFNAGSGIGSVNGTAVVLEGGGITANGSFTNSNGASQHPIRLMGVGGTINVTGANTFSIASSSNTAISGVGLLTKTGTGTLVLASSASNWSGGFLINGGLVNVTATAGTPLGTGAVAVNSGGSLTATGVISNNFAVNSGGSWVVNTGTVSGAVTLNAGAIVTGAGTVSTAVVIPVGGVLNPATTTTLGTLSFQSLGISSGSMLNLTLQAVPKNSDKINILSGGSLTLGASMTVNMFYAGTGAPFFANGSYTLFTGVDVIDAGKYAGGATSGVLSNFVTGNFDTTSGAATVFSILNPGTASSIIVTISGAATVATWNGLGAAGNWQDDNNWDTGAPGQVLGDIASLTGSVVPTTINLNGNVKLGTLGIDSGTNSGGYTLAAGSGPGQLFLNNKTNGAFLTVTNGAQTISANMEIDSPTTISASSTAGSLLVTGVVSNSTANSLINFSGPGTITLAADNTLSSSGVIAANGILQLGNNGASGSWGSGTLTVNGVLAVARTGTFNYTSIAGLVTGAGTVTNAGNGQMMWNSTLTSGGFTGTLNVAAGTVTLVSGAVLPPGLLVGNSGTFDLGGNNLTLGAVTSTGVITNVSATPVQLNINNAAAATLGGTVTNGAGALSIYKTGAGVLTMNGTGSYTGELVVHAGTVQLNSSTAAPAGTTIATDVASGLLVGDGVVVAANIVGLRGTNMANFGWDVPTGSATFAGHVTVGTASQMRFRVQSAGTLTATGVWDMTVNGTASDVILMTSGNIVFDGTGAQLLLSNIIDGSRGETFFIGRAQGGTSNVTNVTFKNGALFRNTSSPGLMAVVNGGNTLGGVAGGSGIQLGATGGTNAAQSLTVDHAYVDIGLLNFELAGQPSANSLTLIGGSITAGSYTKNNNGAVTTFTVDGGDLIATQSNANYLASAAATNLNLAIGANGALIDTTAAGFSLGIGAHIVTGTTGTAGELSVIGTGIITLQATGSTYNGATLLATTGLTGAADNVFSPNSALLVYNVGKVDGGGFSQGIGGIDDSAGTPGVATGFNSLTINVAPSTVYKFAGTLTVAANLTKSGSGTQILTGATSWTGNTAVNGGKLQLGSATTAGLNISTSGSLTFGSGESALATVLGTGTLAGFTAGSLGTRLPGGTANFLVPDGANGSTNFIKFTVFSGGFIDQGSFFNGADYAYVDGIGGFVRAPVYGGGDSGFSAADALTTGTHVLVSGADAVGPNTFNTVKLTSGASLTQSVGSTLNLTNSGILKSGGGSATISGGNILPAFNTELVIRVDQASDNLTINSVIQDNGTTSGGTLLTKSGLGTLTLGAANTFAGKLNLLSGTILVSNASALQNTLVSLVGANTIQFAAGQTTAVFGNLTSSTTSVATGTLTLQDQIGNPVNLIVQISDSPSLQLSSDGFSRINILNGYVTGSGSITIVNNNNTDGRYDFNASSGFTGGATILSGRVQANQQALGPNSLDSSFGTGPVTLTGGTLTTHGSNVAVSFNNNFIFNGSANFNTASASNATLNGNISGAGTVVRGGTGTLIFNGTDSSAFTGTFVNNTGGVTFNSLGVTSSGASWAFNNAAGNTITVNSSVSGTAGFGTLIGTAADTLALTNTNTASNIAMTLRIGDRNESSSFLGAITVNNTTNTAALLKVGTGTLTLGGTGSNFTGNVTIQQGALVVSNLDNATNVSFMTANSLGVGGTVTIGTNATLQYIGSGHSSFKALVLSSGSVIDASGTGAANFNNPAAIGWDASGVARAVTLAGSSTSQNALSAQIIDNGTASVSLVKNGVGVWVLTHSANTFSGGTSVNAGLLLLNNGTNGNAGGTGLISVMTTGGIGGAGTTTAPVQVNTGGHVNPGTFTGNHVGTLNFGNTLTLSAGSILDMDILGPGLPNDLINFTGSGLPNITGGPATVSINLFNAGLNSNYFYNGTYNLFTGIPAAATNSVASTLSSLTIANEGGTGANFQISQSTTNGSAILVTITGAWNNSNWNNANSSNTWTDANDWVGGVPNGSGHIATFGTLVTLGGAVSMNGPKALNNLTFNNTNGYTINASAVSDTLTMANGTTSTATLAVVSTTGTHTINALMSLSAGTTNVPIAGNSILVLNGDISGTGALSQTGSGSLVITGAANYGGGTTIAAGSSLVVGNGGTSGSLAGAISYAGNLIFRHGDSIAYDISNLNQNSTAGTLVQNGTGALTITTSVPGAFIPGPIIVNSGKLIFTADFLTNASQGPGTTTITLNAPGTIDLNGHTEISRAFNGNGTLDNSSGTPATFYLSSTNTSQVFSGKITNTGAPLSLIKDTTGLITLSGTISSTGTLTILGGQITYTNTANTSLGSLIVMGRSATGSAGLLLGAGVNVSTPLQITLAQGNTEFVSNATNNTTTGTFSGNVSVGPDALFNSAVDVRMGNFATAGVLTFTGTISIPNGTKGLVTRGSVTLGGSGLIDDEDASGNAFQIGTPGNTVVFNSSGNSTLQTAGSDFQPGIVLGSTGNAANSTHTISGNAIVRIGVNGAGFYDLQPSTASASSNTLNINGGSLLLGEFTMSGAQAFAGSPATVPQANVIFNGGTVVAGMSGLDMAPAFGPSNLKFTIGAAGGTLDINQKTNVQWGKQLTSTATGTSMTDGGFGYISGSGPGTITLATRQLYKGATTIGRNAVVIAATNDVLGDPSVGAAVNFAGGTLSLTNDLALSLQDGANSTLTHRFSFNASDPMFDTAAGFENGILNPNATASGGKILMSGMGNSSQASTLFISDITSGTYATNGVTFMAWYTANPTASNSYVFSVGGTGTTGSGYQYLQANANSAGNFRAFITAAGNATVAGNGGEINAQAAAPSNGVEHLVAVTIDNSNISLYIDGVLKQTTPLTTASGGTILQNIVANNGILLGGSVWTGDPSLNGSIDEFRVYDQVLSQQYIQASFNASADTLAPTVSVNRNITVANSTVSGASGGTVDLHNFVLSVGGNITGAGTLGLTDGGSMVLTGNSSAGLSIDSVTQLLVGTGGTAGALTGGNVLNAGLIFINRNDTASIWGASISGAGTITHVGSGTTTITGTNTYTGPLLVNAGTILVGNNGTTGTLGAGTVTLLSSVLGFNRFDNGLTVSATIIGGGTVTQVGSGITSVTGNNNYTGGTVLANGELELDSLGAIGTTGTITFNGGALRYSAANTSNYLSRFSTAPNQLYAFDTNGQTITFTSSLNSSGTASSLTKLGVGTLVLTTPNTYVTTNVNGGVLQLNPGAGIGSGNIVFGGPGTLAMNLPGSNPVANNITGAGGTFSQLVGTSILTGNNTWTGGVNIAPGTAIQVGNGATGSLGAGGGVLNNGLLNINRTGTLTISKDISGTGTLAHSGIGTTTLTGAYSASGPVNVNAGTLAFGPTGGTRQTPATLLNMKNLNIASNAVFDMNNYDLLVGNSNLTTVNNEILAGFGLGNPGDPAITSSTALSSGTTFMVPIDADAILGNGNPGSGVGQVWDGVTISQPGTIVVKYTYFGDDTLDGQVDNFDFATAAGNFGQTTPGLANIEVSWLMGDVTLDGVVDNFDFATMAGNFGQGIGNPLGGLESPSAGSSLGGSSAVPEPASLALLGIGAAGLLLRRKKRA